MKHLSVALMLMLVLFSAGCSVAFEDDSAAQETTVYESPNGYNISIPLDWTVEDISREMTRFTSADGQIVATITTELGGVDYYDLDEQMELMQEKISQEVFQNCEISKEDSSDKFYSCVFEGTDKNDAPAAVFLYCQQPYIGTRQYITFATSPYVYDENKSLIEMMVDSFAITFSEDEYLQLMRDRREADAAAS